MPSHEGLRSTTCKVEPHGDCPSVERKEEWAEAFKRLHDIFSVLNLPEFPIAKSEKNSNTVPIVESIKKMKEEIKELKTRHAASLDDLENLKEENADLENKLKEDDANEKTNAARIKQLERELNILSIGKTSSKDEHLLEETKFKYKALRNVVGVKFTSDTIRSPSLVSGYVFNKSTNKVNPFSFDKSKMSNEDIKENIFTLMEVISSHNYRDIPLEIQ